MPWWVTLLLAQPGLSWHELCIPFLLGIVPGGKAKPSNCTMALSKGCLTKQQAKIATVIHQTVICPKLTWFEAQDDPPVGEGIFRCWIQFWRDFCVAKLLTCVKEKMYFLNNGESCKTHSSDFGVAEDQGGGANLDQNCFCPLKQKDRLLEQPVIAGVKCAHVHRAVYVYVPCMIHRDKTSGWCPCSRAAGCFSLGWDGENWQEYLS